MTCVFYVVQVVGVVYDALYVALVITYLHCCFEVISHFMYDLIMNDVQIAFTPDGNYSL